VRKATSNFNKGKPQEWILRGRGRRRIGTSNRSFYEKKNGWKEDLKGARGENVHRGGGGGRRGKGSLSTGMRKIFHNRGKGLETDRGKE